jgi:putative endonuclease
MEKYYFYILHSEKLDKYYIGYTSDLEARLAKHNTHHKGFTGRENDWKVVYTEVFDTKSAAYAREREVKRKKSRKYLIYLIESSK